MFTILSGDAIGGSFANLDSNGRINIDGANGSFLVTIGGNQVTLSNFLLAPVVLAGDYNDDGLVDASDYIVWRKFAGTAGPLPNETESLGEVDDEDYDAWLANFGASGGGGNDAASSTPEPTTVLIALFGWFATLGMRSTGRKHSR